MADNSKNQFEGAIHRTPCPRDTVKMTTEELRETFLVPQLFRHGQIHGIFTNLTTWTDSSSAARFH